MIKSAGFKSGISHLPFQKEIADREKAEQLAVRVGTPLVAIERVRTADGCPVVYSLDAPTEALTQQAKY